MKQQDINIINFRKEYSEDIFIKSLLEKIKLEVSKLPIDNNSIDLDNLKLTIPDAGYIYKLVNFYNKEVSNLKIKHGIVEYNDIRQCQ